MIVRVSEIEAKHIEKPRGGTGTAVQIPYEAAKQYGGQIMAFAFMDLPPEASVGYHRHENDMEIYVLLDGFAEVNDNGQEDVLTPGDMMITAKGESHSIANKTDKNLSFLALILE
ncbi:MAG: cupin domain-containing protein [Deferribacterales bacterium]